MVSTGTVSADDEEFMEDLITIAPSNSGDSDCEIVSVLENKSRPEIKKKPHSDAQKKPRTESSYGKGDFYLPARFFDITRNTSLLSRCRALSVSIVDCGKFPWYYKKKCAIRKPRPKSKQIYTLQNLLEDMSFEQKLKKQKYQKLTSEYKNKNKEVIGKVNLTPSKDPSSVDFKKNIGLVGLKIERKLVGLVFDENIKADKKNRKHTSDKQKNKTLEGKETKNDKGNSLSTEKKKVSKEAAIPSELIVKKIVAKETSLKCSLNINPILSPSVQQKLLEIASKSVQHTTNTSINAVQLLSSNIDTYNNTTILAKTVKHVYDNSTNVSTDESISDKTQIATPKLNVALDKNTLPKKQPGIIKKKKIVGNEIAKEAIPENTDSKKESTLDEEIKPEQVRIKSEPEIKQELKNETLVTDISLNPSISMTHPNSEVASVSPLTNLRSFRRSIENSAVPAAPNQDLRELVGQSITVNVNNQQNSHPPYNMTVPPIQPIVKNLQDSHKNILANSMQSRIGDLKIQTVSQINNSIVPPEIPPSEVGHNVLVDSSMQNNELRFRHNDLKAMSTVRQPETNKPGSQIPLVKKAQEKKIVRVNNAYLMKNQNKHVAVGPYTVPPYQQYRYRPPTSGPVAQWPDNTHFANKMPILMQHLNQKQRPIQPQSFWEYPRINQDYFHRNLNTNINQTYDEYYHNDWLRPPRPPPPYNNVDRRMNYVPPYARQKPRHPNYISPNSKPHDRGFTRELPEKTAFNQVNSLPALSPLTSPLQGSQSTPCLNNVSRALNTPVPTLPTPSATVNNLPALSSQVQTPSVPKPVQEVHTAEILYPNTTFSEESSTSHVIYTEGSNSINVATHENQQYFEPSLAQINNDKVPQSTTVPNEMAPTPAMVSKDNQKIAARALDMPIIVGIESLSKPIDAAKNVLSSQQAKNNTTAGSVVRKLNDAANNRLSPQQITDPTAASKPTHQIKIVPKKRLYIPNKDIKTPPFEGTASSSVIERSVPAVLERNVKKGYSPPILPIPTVQKSYEILALVNAIKTPNNEQNNSNNSRPLTPMKQSGYRNNEVESKSQVITPRKIIAPICNIENPLMKRKLNQTPQSATKARKISIEEYKKRQDESQDRKNKEFSPTKEKSHQKRFNTNNENRGVDLQDLGYDSDPPSKF